MLPFDGKLGLVSFPASLPYCTPLRYKMSPERAITWIIVVQIVFAEAV